MQNANESINSFVWTRSPKQRFFGRDRILLATAQAVLAFNKGSSELVELASESLRILAQLNQLCNTRS